MSSTTSAPRASSPSSSHLIEGHHQRIAKLLHMPTQPPCRLHRQATSAPAAVDPNRPRHRPIRADQRILLPQTQPTQHPHRIAVPPSRRHHHLHPRTLRRPHRRQIPLAHPPIRSHQRPIHIHRDQPHPKPRFLCIFSHPPCIYIHKPFIIFHLPEIYSTFTLQPGDTGSRHHKGLFMFHKNVLTSLRSISPQQIPASSPSPPIRIALVPSRGEVPPQKKPSPLLRPDLPSPPPLFLVLRRGGGPRPCPGPARRFMLKGRMELNWVISAFAISIALLAPASSRTSRPAAGSSVTDDSSRQPHHQSDRRPTRSDQCCKQEQSQSSVFNLLRMRLFAQRIR